jgi:hypothetical protein
MSVSQIVCDWRKGTACCALTTWVVLLVALSILISPSYAQDAACPPSGQLAMRLTPGIRAWVEPGPGSANNLRANPGLNGEVIGKVGPGVPFDVLDGPQCADNYVWWQIDLDGTQGWTAEYDPSAGRYWLEPLTQVVDPALDALDFCQLPPDDYTVIEFGNYAQLNARTVAMLDQATAIYHALGGLLDFDFRNALVQGSYNPGAVEASFGTHDGGGAVDLSVRAPVTRVVMTDEIPLMLRALRIAGFAAWLRDTSELYEGSPIHIHAIAIGDRELSDAARQQIDGPFGYLRGYNGLPQDSGVPLPDTSGEMVICQWMTELGYGDMRAAE